MRVTTLIIACAIAFSTACKKEIASVSESWIIQTSDLPVRIWPGPGSYNEPVFVQLPYPGIGYDSVSYKLDAGDDWQDFVAPFHLKQSSEVYTKVCNGSDCIEEIHNYNIDKKLRGGIYLNSDTGILRSRAQFGKLKNKSIVTIEAIAGYTGKINVYAETGKITPPTEKSPKTIVYGEPAKIHGQVIQSGKITKVKIPRDKIPAGHLRLRFSAAATAGELNTRPSTTLTMLEAKESKVVIGKIGFKDAGNEGTIATGDGACFFANADNAESAYDSYTDVVAKAKKLAPLPYPEAPFLRFSMPIDTVESDTNVFCINMWGQASELKTIKAEKKGDLSVTASGWFQDKIDVEFKAKPDIQKKYNLVYNFSGDALDDTAVKTLDWGSSLSFDKYTEIYYGLAYKNPKDQGKGPQFAHKGYRIYRPLPPAKAKKAKPVFGKVPWQSYAAEMKQDFTFGYRYLPVKGEDLNDFIAGTGINPKTTLVGSIAFKKKALEAIKQLGARRWKNRYFQAVSSILNMSPGSMTLSGSSLSQLDQVAEDLVNMEVFDSPEYFYAQMYNMNSEKFFYTSKDLHEAIFRNHIVPNNLTDKNGRLFVTLQDILTNFQSFSRYKGAGPEGVLHDAPNVDVKGPKFALAIPIKMTSQRIFGLNPANGRVAPAKAVPKTEMRLITRRTNLDTYMARLEGVRREKFRLNIKVGEDRSGQIETGYTPTKDTRGASPMWKLPKHRLEYMLVEIAFNKYGKPPAKTHTYNNDNFGGKVGELNIGNPKIGIGSYTQFFPAGVLKVEPPAFYNHEAIAVAAQIVIHENGKPEGHGDLKIPVFDNTVALSKPALHRSLKPLFKTEEWKESLKPYWKQAGKAKNAGAPVVWDWDIKADKLVDPNKAQGYKRYDHKSLYLGKIRKGGLWLLPRFGAKLFCDTGDLAAETNEKVRISVKRLRTSGAYLLYKKIAYRLRLTGRTLEVSKL